MMANLRVRVSFVLIGLLTLLAGCHGAFDADNTITVSGVVSNKSDNQPISDALVEITNPPQLQHSTRSDSAGLFRFELESESKVSIALSVTKEKFEISNRSLEAESGTDLTGINFPLAAKKDSTGGGDGGGSDGDNGKGAAGISLKNEPPQAINIDETGSTVSAPFTFQVTDSAGQALTSQKAVEVQFKLVSSPGGKEHLVPSKAVTDDRGTVTTTLYSGNKAGEVKLQAIISKSEMGSKLKSSPVLIAIHGGFPDAAHFSMSRDKKNIEGYTLDNKRVPFSVILGDKFSNPVKPGTIIYFKSTGGVMQGSAKTDEDGTATVDLITGDPRPKDGLITVTASTVNSDDQQIKKRKEIIFSTSKALIKASPASFDLNPGESQNINYTVSDLNSNSMASGTTIKVNGDDGIDLSGDTNVTLGDFLTSGKDHTDFQLTIRNTTTSTDDHTNSTVEFTVTAPSGKTTVDAPISGTLRGNPKPPPPPEAADIELVEPPQDAIRIAATGENVSTPMSFQVLDQAGDPLSKQQAVQVKFSLTESPGDNEHLDPTEATTDADGNVTTHLISGNKAGVVQVRASVELDNGKTVSSAPVQVAINGGYPDLDHFKLIPSSTSVDLTADVKPSVDVELGDQFSNPVKPGTAVSFKTSSGVIQGSANTDDQGHASVQFTSLPDSSTEATVTATTINSDNQKINKQAKINFYKPSTSYPDKQHFGISASRRNVVINSDNLPSIKVSVGNKNGNPVEPGTKVSFKTTGGVIQQSATTDANGNATVDFSSLKPRPADGHVTVTASTKNANAQTISKTQSLIFSTADADISATPNNFDLNPGENRRIDYTVSDKDGNPMSKGTKIKITADQSVNLTGDTDETLGDYISGGPGKTNFTFTLEDNGQSSDENIDLSLKVTPPVGKSTTYTKFDVKRKTSGQNKVGPAAILLTKTPEDAINISETGDDVSAPLTFQVQDSLGRPLTADNEVKVKFDLVSSPGGGEDLVPHEVMTDGNGNVTTTLYSGNRAGAVKVQASIQRTDIGLTIKSKPVLIAIHGGFPDQSHFSISPAKHNFEAYDINNIKDKITVVLGDKFSNPVKPGTVVYFSTDGGIIQGSANTDEDGIASVNLISGNPRPNDGKVTVTASTVNENDTRIKAKTDLIFATSNAKITAEPDTGPDDFTIPNGGGKKFSYTITDELGNPMPAGTQINVDAGSGLELTGDVSFTLGDHLETGPSRTEFNFSASDADDKNSENADVTIKITVTTPNGKTTSFSNLQGVRQELNDSNNPDMQIGN